VNTKRLKFLAIVACVFVILYPIAKFYIPSNLPGIAHIVNKNSIVVTSSEDIDHDEVKIELTIAVAEIDHELIYANSAAHGIPKEYGEHAWRISYKGKQFEFRHFKTNNWHDHDYRFHFFKASGEIKCKVDIQGPDARNFVLTLEKP
jgi:hypothetical protein